MKVNQVKTLNNDKINTRIHGDSYNCLQDAVGGLNAKLVISDPPFQKDRCYTKYEKAGKNVGLLSGPINNYTELYRIFHRITSVEKGRVISFGNCHTYPLQYIAAWPLFHHSKSLVWNKNRGCSGYHYRMAHSLMLLSWHEGDALSTKYDSVISCSSGKDKRHPYQLPRKLVEHLILHLTEKGDLVVDPFAGSFIIGDMCSELDRNYIGIEIDNKYHD